MTTQFASGRNQLLPPSIYNIGSGNIMGGSTLYYFWLQGRNRVGYNTPSTSSSMVVPNNCALGITIAGINYLDSENWFEFLIYTSQTNDFSTAQLVGSYRALDVDQITKRTLGSSTPLSSDPHQIVLTENYQLNITTTVTDPTVLPVLPIHGMRRFITSLSQTFRYDETSTATVNNTTVLSATTGRWIYTGSTHLVEDPTDLTNDPNGCNQDLNTIAGNPDLILATYNVSGNIGIPVHYYLKSSSNTTITKGTPIVLSARIDDIDVTSDFNLLFDIIIYGKVSTTDYSLITTNFLSAGSSVPYDHFKHNIILEDDINPNEYLLLSITPHFATTDIDINITPQVSLSIYPYFAQNTSTYADSNLTVGNIIFKEYDNRIVVPYGFGAIKVLGGSGCINLYTWRNQPATILTNYVASTAGQYVLTTRTGAALIGTPSSIEPIRAVISTVAGFSTPCNWSTTTSITAGQTVNYNITISQDSEGYNPINPTYTDLLLRGLVNKAKLNTNKILLLIKIDTVCKGFIITFDPTLTTLSGIVTDWSAGTVYTDSDILGFNKNLFRPLEATHTVTGTGSNFPSGTSVAVAYSFLYDGTSVSDVSHSPIDGCITTQFISDSDLGARYLFWGEAVTDLTALRALLKLGDSVPEARYVATKRHPYHYDSASTLDDDNEHIIKPNDITASGRWLADYSNAWYTGTSIPSNSLGDYGDWYLKSDTSDLYVKDNSNTWIFNSNIKGLGTSWHSGSGVPSNSLGVNGDYYLDLNTANIYIKTAGVYSLSGNIRGVQGSVWRNGSGVPDDSIGISGDYYLDNSTGTIYYKASTTYNIIGIFSGTSTTGSLALNNLGSTNTNATQIALLNQDNSLQVQDSSNGAKHLVAVLDKSQVFRKPQIIQPVILPFSSTVSVDASLSDTFDISLTDNITLQNPTNLRNGQILRFRCTEDNTGTRVVSYDTLYDFGSAGTPTTPISANKMNIVTCISDGLGLACSIQTGYSYTIDPTVLLLPFAGNIEDVSRHYNYTSYDIINNGTTPCSISTNTTSLLIDNPAQSTANNYARLLINPSDNALFFNELDFTIEVWLTLDLSVGTYMNIIGDTSSNWNIGFDLVTSKLGFNISAEAFSFIRTNSVLTTNTPAHLAVYRIGSNIYIALNGDVNTTPLAITTTGIMGTSALPLFIGVKDTASLTSGYGFKGSIEGIKITVGTALYGTTSFTSPSAP